MAVRQNELRPATAALLRRRLAAEFGATGGWRTPTPGSGDGAPARPSNAFDSARRRGCGGVALEEPARARAGAPGPPELFQTNIPKSIERLIKFCLRDVVNIRGWR